MTDEIRYGCVARPEAALRKREAGEPADLRHWDDRKLPEPSARWSWASIADAQTTGQRLGDAADRLALNCGQAVSVIADGAGWIWKQADEHLPDHEGVGSSFLDASAWSSASRSGRDI